MNVTKDNFPSVVDELSHLLPSASFVAIDEEMSGIHMPDSEAERMDDTTEGRYAKMKSVAETYSIIQIGMCLFHEATPEQQQQESQTTPSASASTLHRPPSFIARPYNFYLFPASGRIVLEASAIAFNKRHGMDFNKWMYEGIPFVSAEGEQTLKEKFYKDENGWKLEVERAKVQAAGGVEAVARWIEQKEQEKKEAEAAAANNGSAIPSTSSSSNNNNNDRKRRQIKLERPTDVAFLKDVQSRIERWLRDRQPDEHELPLPSSNSFLRAAVYQWFESLTEDDPILNGVNKLDLALETRRGSEEGNRDVSFILTYYTGLERKIREAEALEKKRRDFDEFIGFRRVWNLLQAARVPIVVHNGFYDLLFMFSHLERTSLPDSLAAFKKSMSAMFPAGVFDTKFMSNNRQFCYPFEFLANQAKLVKGNDATNNASSSNQLAMDALQSARLSAFTQLNLPPESLLTCRFRETHLEKLYLVLQQEDKLRKEWATKEQKRETKQAANESSNAMQDVAAATQSASASPSTSSSALALPPLPLADVSISLAPSFDKYALVGEEGGDPSAAHEAGYDAWMTGAIFAHFAAEAPKHEVLDYLREIRKRKNDDGSISNTSTTSPSPSPSVLSPWLNRVPLFRHLMSLNFNLDDSGMPRSDTLVEKDAVVYLMSGVPNDWRNEDVLKLFEPYTRVKRKREMDEEEEDAAVMDVARKSPRAASSADATSMRDVSSTEASSSSSSSSPSATAPLPVSAPSVEIVTSAPRLIWVDSSSVFLSIPKCDASKMERFIEEHISKKKEAASKDDGDAEMVDGGGVPSSLMPTGLTISKFSESS